MHNIRPISQSRHLRVLAIERLEPRTVLSGTWGNDASYVDGWEYEFDFLGPNNFQFVEHFTDGGVVAANDAVAYRFDNSGSPLHSIEIPGVVIAALATASNGDYLVAGQARVGSSAIGGWDTTRNGDTDAYLARVSADGAILWSTFAGGNDWESASDVITAPDGGIYLVGGTNSSNYEGSFIAEDGRTLDRFIQPWVTGGPDMIFGSLVDTATSPGRQIRQPGNYDIENTIYGVSLAGEGFVAKFDATGQHIWSSYAPHASNASPTSGGVPFNDGGGNARVALSGSGQLHWAIATPSSGLPNFPINSIRIATLDAGGEVLWSDYIPQTTVYWRAEYSIASLSDGEVVVGYQIGERDEGGAAQLSLVSADGGLEWTRIIDAEKSWQNEIAGVSVGVISNAGSLQIYTGASFFDRESGYFGWSVQTRSRSGDLLHEVEPRDAAGRRFARFSFAADGSFYATGGQHVSYQPRALPTHAIVEVLSRDYVYSNRLSGRDDRPLDGDTPSLGYGYRVSHVFEGVGLDGLYAIGLISNFASPLLLFRGTDFSVSIDGIKDIFSNVNPEGIGYDQFLGSRTQLIDWLDQHSLSAARASVAGHSLGGAIAQWTAATYTSRGMTLRGDGLLSSVITFNSPGISNEVASQFVSMSAGDVTHYITSGDIVSLAGEAFIAGEYVLTQFGIWGDTQYDPRDQALPILRHLVPVLNERIGGRERPIFIKQQVTRQTTELNDPLFGYRDVEHIAFIASATAVVNALPFVPSELRTLPPKFLFRSTTEAFRRDVGLFLATYADAIGERGPNQTGIEIDVPIVAFNVAPFLATPVPIVVEDMKLAVLTDPSPEFRFSGKVTVPFFLNATADFSGDNFIRWTDRGFDWAGELVVRDIQIRRALNIAEARLIFDSVNNRIGGGVTVQLLGRAFPDLRGRLIFQEFENAFRLDEIEFGVEAPTVSIGGVGGRGVPIGPQPIYYLQSLVGGARNFYETDPEPLEIFGQARITAGPEIVVDLGSRIFGGSYSATLKDFEGRITLIVEEAQIRLDGKMSLLKGSIGGASAELAEIVLEEGTLDLDDLSLVARGNARFLGNFATAELDFRIDKNLNASFYGAAQVTLPRWVPFVGGRSAAGGIAYVLSNNNDLSDDYFAAWFTRSTGLFSGRTIGVRLSLDGEFERLVGGAPLPPAASSQEGNVAALRSGDSAFFDVSAETPWLILSGESEEPLIEDLEFISPSGQRLTVRDLRGRQDVEAEVDSDDNGEFRHTLLIDRPETGRWEIRTSEFSNASEIEFDALVGVPQSTFLPFQVSLSFPADGVPPRIAFDRLIFVPEPSSGTITFYYDTDGSGGDGIQIGDPISVDQYRANRLINDSAFYWYPEFVEPGNYYVYAVIDDGVNVPDIVYSLKSVSVGRLTGDYDGSGFVDSQDSLVWQADFGKQGIGLRADGNFDGRVDAADYTLWRDHVGTSWVSRSEFLRPTVTGDYNRDQVVDEDDYELWRSQFGRFQLGNPADSNFDGVVDAADYTVWRDNFGESVAEPPSLRGDYDRSGVVDSQDYEVWKEFFGIEVSHFSGPDGNGDGVVDAADYTVWRDSFNLETPTGGTAGSAKHSRLFEPKVPLASSESDGTSAIASGPSDTNQRADAQPIAFLVASNSDSATGPRQSSDALTEPIERAALQERALLLVAEEELEGKSDQAESFVDRRRSSDSDTRDQAFADFRGVNSEPLGKW